MNPQEVHDLIRRLTAVFDALEISYIIGGSMASSVHGFVRATNDVDFAVRMRQEQVPLLAEALKADFYADADMMAEAIRSQSSFNLLHLTHFGKADIFIAKEDAFTEQEFSRRHRQKMDTQGDSPYEIYVASPEDIILQKLRWYRLGNEISDRQWNDVLGVLKVQAPVLEYPYMNHWAKELGVDDLLRRAYDDAGTESRHF